MRGFSLVETMVAMLITLVLGGALLQSLSSAQTMFSVQAQLPDMRQRLRNAADTLSRDVLTAGGGSFPPIVPHRRGLERPDVPGTFWRDRLSVLYLPAAGPQTTLAAAIDGSTVMLVRPQQGCTAADPLCGFRAGMLAVIFDETHAYDTFLISGVSNEPPALIYAGFSLSKAYAPGATVAEAASATYWLQPDAAGSGAQLMRYDGDTTDLPLADNIADLRFEYYADPHAPLDPLLLSDGPWLPDAASAQRFDGDLLRIRRVRAMVRVRASQLLLPSPIADRTIELDMAVRSRNLAP